ncbi:MAG: ABC transporter substrate-binding protein [Firmicutes bacterium]|nr:ABC transporter substrate-binding protein [Bacillota bacterium]
MKRRKFPFMMVMLILLVAFCACGHKNETDTEKSSVENKTDGMKSISKEEKTEPGSKSSMGEGMGDGMKSSGMNEIAGQKETVSEGSGYPVTITDMLGNTVTLKKKPERIAAISGTFLGLLYSVGGTSICAAEFGGGSPVPKGVESLPTIGKVYKPDVEKILELQPDLVIAQFGLQNSVVPALKQSGIQVLSLEMRTYQDVLDKLRMLGRIVGNEKKAEELITKMEKDKKSIVDKLPDKAARVVILYVTSQDVSVKLSNSIAGNVAEILKLENIAAGSKPESMGGETTPFSMETIVEKDPDVILVTSMLSEDTSSQKVIEEKLGNDPVWKELRAVKENRIVFLPQKYFLYNAGADFVEGIEYMAKGVYPEIYGGLNE